jgi:hypothetical protein
MSQTVHSFLFAKKNSKKRKKIKQQIKYKEIIKLLFKIFLLLFYVSTDIVPNWFPKVLPSFPSNSLFPAG